MKISARNLLTHLPTSQQQKQHISKAKFSRKESMFRSGM